MYPRLHLSLTDPGIGTLGLVQWGLTLLIVGSLAIAGYIVWYTGELTDEITYLEQGLTQIQASNHQLMSQAASKGFDLSNSRIQALPKEVAFARQIRKQQSFSWTRFLNDLEATVPPKVSMDSVVLNFKEGSIALSGTSATLKDLNSLVNRLETHPAFHHVVLSRHALKNMGKNKKKRFLQFTMTVGYTPV